MENEEGEMVASRKPYAVQAVEYYTQAQQELESGDLRQASEKGWGAAAQMIKAVAERRRWNHSSHVHLHDAISRLSDELEDDDLVIQFGNAGYLHTNFYEGWLDRKVVTLYLYQVKQLVDKLQRHV